MEVVMVPAEVLVPGWALKWVLEWALEWVLKWALV